MSEAAITQFLFDAVTAILLLLWYFPLRWVMSEQVHPCKINILLQATLAFERSIKAFCLTFCAIIPMLVFFILQQLLLPKFIIAGHFGIWVASAPLFIVACYFEYYLLQYLFRIMVLEYHSDTEDTLADLRTRCTNTLDLIQENNSLRASQIKLATEADAQINSLIRKAEVADKEHRRLLEKLQQTEQRAKQQVEQPVKWQKLSTRPDANYYVCIRQMVEQKQLLKNGIPVSMAYARRNLTKERPWIKQAKGGGALYAKVEHLLRKGYETAAKPLAKTLLFRCNSATGTFDPINAQMPDNEAVERLSVLPKRSNAPIQPIF